MDTKEKVQNENEVNKIIETSKKVKNDEELIKEINELNANSLTKEANKKSSIWTDKAIESMNCKNESQARKKLRSLQDSLSSNFMANFISKSTNKDSYLESEKMILNFYRKNLVSLSTHTNRTFFDIKKDETKLSEKEKSLNTRHIRMNDKLKKTNFVWNVIKQRNLFN